MESEQNVLLQSVSYYDALEQMRDGVYIIDRDFVIRYWNGAAEEILGYAASDVCGWSCRSLGPLCKRDVAGNSFCGDGLCPLDLAVRGGYSGRYPHYVFARRADGREIPLSLSVGPLKDDDGRVRGGLCVFRDMSEEYGQLRLAAEIQRRMVSDKAFSRSGFTVEPLFKPLEMTGGDFVEAFFNDRGLLVASSADATGHGISAALFAVIYKALFHSGIGSSSSPAEMLAAINDGFCRTSTVEGYYLTASIVVLDPRTGEGRFASAGHPTALIFRNRQGCLVPEPIRDRSFMIGMVEGARYEDASISLEAGDKLLLASDGIYEAEDGAGEAFGLEGVAAYFADGGSSLEQLYETLRARNPLGELADDASAILISAEDTRDR